MMLVTKLLWWAFIDGMKNNLFHSPSKYTSSLEAITIYWDMQASNHPRIVINTTESTVWEHQYKQLDWYVGYNRLFY